jgi:hypothetical protein
MAKKRTKTAAKRKKTKKTKRPVRKAAKRKAAPKVARKRKKRARKAKSLGERISSALRTVVGSVEDTEKLRAKMEPRGADETQ